MGVVLSNQSEASLRSPKEPRQRRRASPSRRRTASRSRRSQRFAAVAIGVCGLFVFGSAAALATARWVIDDRQIIDLASASRNDQPVVVTGVDPTEKDLNNAATLTLAEPEASNFLITGADSGDCENQGDPTTSERESERSDTIMIWRINPETDQLAVLSLPRDLWVKRPGKSNSRINNAYDPDDPRELIETIDLNFDIPINHYVQVDFCAFRTLVNAVGGVSIPFDFPAKDEASLLDIPTTGCVELDGNMALSYVRSRHYRYEDPPGSGNWKTDGTSDLGRIARQQDFLRRIVAKIIDEGLYSPAVASGLIKTNAEYIVTDSELSVRRMLEFANSLQSMDPSQIATYRIESYADNVGGAAIERPRIGGENMQAILSVFRGEALLASAPTQEFAPTTTNAPLVDDSSEASSPTTSPPGTAPSDGTASAGTTIPPTTSVVAGKPVVDVPSNNLGVVPNPNILCD